MNEDIAKNLIIFQGRRITDVSINYEKGGALTHLNPPNYGKISSVQIFVEGGTEYLISSDLSNFKQKEK